MLKKIIVIVMMLASIGCLMIFNCEDSSATIEYQHDYGQNKITYEIDLGSKTASVTSIAGGGFNNPFDDRL